MVILEKMEPHKIDKPSTLSTCRPDDITYTLCVIVMMCIRVHTFEEFQATSCRIELIKALRFSSHTFVTLVRWRLYCQCSKLLKIAAFFVTHISQIRT